MALPHLPPLTELSADESPVSLIDGFLAYPPPSRLLAAQALRHAWFSTDLLLPPSHPGPGNTGETKNWLTTWQDKALADWLEPALVREATIVTRENHS
jgi:hypothetical protein